jgi:HK97 gp10 family phage protein
MADTVTVTGLDELHKRLQQLPARIEKNIMAGAMRAGQNVIKKRAQANVPVSSGALKKSIRVTTSTKSGRVKVSLKAGDLKAWYAHIIEFGSGSFYSGTLGKSKRAPYIITPKEGGLYFNGIFTSFVIHPGVRPAAYMRRALDAGINEPLQVVADYIRARLDKEIV